MRPRALLFLAILPLLVSANAPQKTTEYWYDFKFQGHKVGFLQAIDEPTTVNDRPAIHSKRWSKIVVRREKNEIKMESTTDVWSDADFRPMRYKHVRVENNDERTAEGYRDGKEFVVRKSIGGNLVEKRFPLTDDLRLSTSLDELFNRSLKVGKTLSGKAIVEEEGEINAYAIKVTGTEKRPEGEAFVVESTVAGLTSRELVLADGRTLRVEIPSLGAEFELTTPEKAIMLETPVDIFSSALFKLDKPLPDGPSLDELVVRLSTLSGKRPTSLSDERQKAKPVGKGDVELHIRAAAPPMKSPKLPITTASVKTFLKETPYESIHDERLVGAERRVVGDEKNAWEAAKRINAFVYKHIQNKTLSRAFASANEALETREGDCTEHAVLFSALAKIAGIPTRLATGLVYVGGRNNVFGYHEWVEVWMGDRWVDMDPTFGQDIADPTHIKFAHGQSDSDGLRDAGIVAAGLIGDLQLKVQSYTTASGDKTVLD
jgi:hypothetical protein